jgi:hypothetical protein
VALGQSLFLVALLLLPTLQAIWSFPGFVTQDGPAHLYNSQILLESLRQGQDSPYARAFEPRWKVLPNWAGHLLQMSLLAGLSPRAADRMMLTLTLIFPIAAALWLRWRVAGPRGFLRAAILILLLGLNLPWLLGFQSFLLGLGIGLVTIGAWWGPRGGNGLAWQRTAVVAALLVIGFFCHPISLGLTVLTLLVLPLGFGKVEGAKRLRASLLAMLPLFPLGMAYMLQIGSGGSIAPMWETSGFPQRPSAWPAQFFWADPITLSRKDRLPFVESTSRLYALAAPVFWMAVGLALCVVAVWANGLLRVDSRRGRVWISLVFALVLGGAIAPDTLGPNHGNYLPQRVVLFGLFLLAVAIPLSGKRSPAGRACLDLGTGMLAVALLLQSAFVRDYAITANRFTNEFLAASSFVGRDQRVATLFVNPRGPYRSNPLLHVDNLLGIGSGNIMWSNYEAGHYYFPVRVREDIAHPPVGEFERISLMDDPRDLEHRAREWGELLDGHHAEIDVVLMRGRDPALDAQTAVHYELVYDLPGNPVRVWKRRSGAPK